MYVERFWSLPGLEAPPRESFLRRQIIFPLRLSSTLIPLVLFQIFDLRSTPKPYLEHGDHI